MEIWHPRKAIVSASMEDVESTKMRKKPSQPKKKPWQEPSTFSTWYYMFLIHGHMTQNIQFSIHINYDHINDWLRIYITFCLEFQIGKGWLVVLPSGLMILPYRGYTFDRLYIPHVCAINWCLGIPSEVIVGNMMLAWYHSENHLSHLIILPYILGACGIQIIFLQIICLCYLQIDSKSFFCKYLSANHLSTKPNRCGSTFRLHSMLSVGKGLCYKLMLGVISKI